MNAGREVLVRADPRNRHIQASRLFPELQPGDRVLDVGGFVGNSALSSVTPNAVTIDSININPETHGRVPTVYGNALNIPFKEDSYALVSCVDVLQQIPSYLRLTAVREMMRVSRDRTVLSVPFDSEQNTLYDLRLIKNMQESGLQPKQAVLIQRLVGTPRLSDLVEIGRELRFPFEVHASTVRSTLFQATSDQVAVHAKVSAQQADPVARAIALNAEQLLIESPQPSWEEAYRAVMSLKKKRKGTLIDDPQALFPSRNEIMAYQAALRQAGWGHVKDNDIERFYKENPLRGRNIVIEGPEGSGKTTIVRKVTQTFLDWGYTLTVQTDHGLRQSIRDMEKKFNRVISDPERAEYFAFAMIEAAVAGNAFSLLGPCYIAINDRGIESVRMHHGWHCPDNITIPHLLEDEQPISVPPDLTIVLMVPDEEHNFCLMQKDGDLVNATKGKDALQFQREFYTRLVLRGGSQYTGPVVHIPNPGTEGSIDQVVTNVLTAIEYHCKIPTTLDAPRVTS